MMGLSVGDTTLGTLIANLGYDRLTMPKPVFLGGTLRGAGLPEPLAVATAENKLAQARSNSV